MALLSSSNFIYQLPEINGIFNGLIWVKPSDLAIEKVKLQYTISMTEGAVVQEKLAYWSIKPNWSVSLR